MTTNDRVTVKTPGSTSNLGSGFDTMGIALSVYNRVTISRSTRPGVAISSPIAEEARPGAERMIGSAVDAFRQVAHAPTVGLEVYLDGDVPIARGLGSSVTVRIGVLAGLNQLEGAPLPTRQIVELAIEAEGHPDNAAPSALGGFVAAGRVDGAWRWFNRPIDERLRFVTVIPEKQIRTEDARRVMPSGYASSDVAHILNRSTLVCAALMTGDFAALRGLFEDRMHQPYRASIFPEFPSIIDAGVAAGAIGGWLSGSGSTVICVTLENESSIADAMRVVAGEATIRILTADNHGMRLES